MPAGEEEPITSQARNDRDDQLLTVADIAGYIGTREQTVRGWLASGELRGSKFGTRLGYRVRRADYDDFFRRRQLTGAIARQLLSLGVNELDPAT